MNSGDEPLLPLWRGTVGGPENELPLSRAHAWISRERLCELDHWEGIEVTQVIPINQAFQSHRALICALAVDGGNASTIINQSILTSNAHSDTIARGMTCRPMLPATSPGARVTLSSRSWTAGTRRFATKNEAKQALPPTI